MADPKKTFLITTSLFTLAFWVLFPSTTFASNNKYYDFGSYYGNPQVLGFSFSNLDKLPIPQIPDNIIPTQAKGILPDSFFYPFEKTAENIQLAFTFDPVKKETLRLEIASERLSEAKTLMEAGQTIAASQALDDYNQTLISLSQNLSALAKRTDPASTQLISEVEKTVAAQTVVAVNLSLSAPPAQAEAWTYVAKTNRQLADEVAKIQGQPPIPEQVSESLQRLKEQGILSEEETNKIYSLKERGQVRDELDKLVSSGQFPPSEAVKMDETVAKNFPDVQKQYLTNLQVLELKFYQNQPQPDNKLIAELKKIKDNSDTPPSNDIKPYLWYNRAQELAKEVDLSNFSQNQQSEVAKFYPQAVTDNPTYSPPPSPAPTLSPSPAPAPSDSGNQTASPPPTSPSPSPSAPTAQPYVGVESGALPGDLNYNIKRWNEQLSLSFTFDPAEKAKLRIQIAEKRLAETIAILAKVTDIADEPKKASLYEKALKTYQSAINDAANLVKELKDPQDAKNAAERLEAQSARHQAVFEKGLLPSPDKNSKLIAEVIKTTEDAMDKSADVLGRPALPAGLSARLGDLKAQGLILPEEAQDLINSASREEAREKIRKLTELNTFPLADAKKLDEAQTFTIPSDYNQLVEVRKIEELQGLRSIQSDLAQTPTLKLTASNLTQRESVLVNSFDPTTIKVEDLKGRDDMVKVYQTLVATSSARPINSGQFGPEATPGAQPAVTPARQDALLSACPEGAVFKQLEGCVWADSGKRLGDFEQYRCEGSRQYYSFAAKKCFAYDISQGWSSEDAQPICPLGYNWSWQTQSCQTSTGGIRPFPSPSPQPEPIDDKEREERAKSCPEGSSYKPPNGCVWDNNNKSVYDVSQYRCSRGQYYSFDQQKCVANPQEGQPYPGDAEPACQETNTYWSWSSGKCVLAATVSTPGQEGAPASIVDEIRPGLLVPGNPFYFLKQAGEGLAQTFAFTPEAKEDVSLSQAEDRLAEAIDALKKNNEQGVKTALSAYTETMQRLISDTSKAQLNETTKIKIGKKLNESAVEHNLLLQRLSAWAPKEQDNEISAAISATILGVDKAADIAGEPSIPDEIKSKIEALPERMISEEDKKKLLETNSRVEVRLKIDSLLANGGLNSTDTAFLNEDLNSVNREDRIKTEELKKLEEITESGSKKDQLDEAILKNEQIVEKLTEFEKSFEPGKNTPQDIPTDVRPYVKLTRINEITQTIRPDIVNLEDFANRKDLVLAVATLQEEFRPTKESFQQIADFRRRNPNIALPPELSRIEALSYSLGVRQQATSCFLPTPPFPANTPCPAPGASIPIASYYSSGSNYYGSGYNPANINQDTVGAPVTDKDGKPLAYGQGPKPETAGVCPSGYHWMYDSGGWCMSNAGNYSSSYNYTPTGTGSGYTPYSPYYTAPGAPPATYGYTDSSTYNYSPPSYYGAAPAYYTTTPPAGTVPGSGPRPTSPGQCPSGFHWMSDSGGWCMSDGPTYVPGGTVTTSGTPPPGGYNNNYYSPNLNQSSCGPGYYWDGRGCIRTSPTDTYGSCTPPPAGCGTSAYWDYGSCSCRGSNTYSGGGGTPYTPSGYSSCSPPPGGCGSGWFDSSSCSCKQASSQGCYNVSASSCGSGFYWDAGLCTCRSNNSSSGTSNTGSTSSGSCSSGYHWMTDNGGWCMSDAARDSAPGGSSSGSNSGGSTSSGSCPGGYHWMSDNGGWCMQDGGGSTSSTPTSGSTTSPSSTPAPTTTESAPAPAPATEPAPAPATEPAPAPASEPAPAPATEPAPAP